MSECRRAVPGVNDEYAGLAKSYDSLIEPLVHGVRKAVVRRIAELGARRVLDVACGTGKQLEMLSGRGLVLTGIDASASMLGVAGEKTSPEIKYVSGNAADMPFEDNSFDCVSATFALHEMAGEMRVPVLGEMARVMSPGGRLLIIDYARSKGPAGRLVLMAAHLIERAAGVRHYGCFRDFIVRGGVPGLASTQGLEAEQTRAFMLGAAGMFEVGKS